MLLSNNIRNILFIILSCCMITQGYARSNKNLQECVLVTGKIVQNPSDPVFRFVKSHRYSTDNYVVSHTKFFINGSDGHQYEIIMNNLFYSWVSASQAITNKDIGITENMRHNYPIGSDVAACGIAFNHDGHRGVKSVHSSACDQTPFNGYLTINGSNIMDNKSYCNSCNCKL